MRKDSKSFKQREKAQETDLTIFLSSLGFSQGASEKVSEMLPTIPDWDEQFETGKTSGKLLREGKTTKAQGLPDMDIDSRDGKQRGGEGKQEQQSSLSIQASTLISANPQPGPRSRVDRKGLSMF
jgi:hypothetical protein